jgi:Protein phosphatase 2C.
LIWVREAGGYVMQNRVSGILAISRAFGDFPFKKEVEKTILTLMLRE